MITLGYTIREDIETGEIVFTAMSPRFKKKGNEMITSNEAEEAEWYDDIIKAAFNARDCAKAGGGIVETDGKERALAENPVVAVMQMIEMLRHSGKSWPDSAVEMVGIIEGCLFGSMTDFEKSQLAAEVAEKTGQKSSQPESKVVEFKPKESTNE